MLKQNFDGAPQDGVCGIGMVLFIKQDHFINLWMRTGLGINTKAQLIALWGLLWFSRKRCILDIHIVGDSKVVIDWVYDSKVVIDWV